ncbi:MAG: isopentenyl-diphosphate Delta-isomerase [Nitrososphaerota archaeon]|nr:isopentenyl-diphosphate Delta-isomerase [Nitrososphaerota archaeon]MCL5672513.1 isopentenyl-diphosphate Delta-isomerase [Nitrososphaerota archaeon]MDG6903720.1 isopentenyl-diphosphate Delta-isomerase [Nitrososphaerota archaeon]MDG6912185.1 isopentenyl-diphosphate Delta-isomerase [Nitrososphaerota archaeon]MDG6924569.1 isopentenyl-diphosphate Delta-isomerase [Nitrososphaerota archaeon]
MAKEEILILVDEHDREIGTDTRESCHAGKGKRHRAYTALIFHGGKLLLQQRSQKKLLWPGAWDVSFTSHVYPGETYQQAASRRAKEELSATVGELEDVHSFVYFAPQGANAENEFCRVLVGDFDGAIVPNGDEMSSVRWASVTDVVADLTAHPDSYTPWFKLSFEGFLKSRASSRYA